MFQNTLETFHRQLYSRTDNPPMAQLHPVEDKFPVAIFPFEMKLGDQLNLFTSSFAPRIYYF